MQRAIDALRPLSIAEVWIKDAHRISMTTVIKPRESAPCPGGTSLVFDYRRLGLSDEAIVRASAPSGLDIGAAGSAEIAEVILAQISEALRRGGTANHGWDGL